MTNEAQSDPGGTSAEQGRRGVFDKPHLEPKDLVEKLRGQGMTVEDDALPYFLQVGGYRMKGYWFKWLDPSTKQFPAGTNYRQAIERYEFDRELRQITIDPLERIEVMLRAAISNVMSKHEGPHWFERDELFDRRPKTVRLPDGSQKVIPPSEPFHERVSMAVDKSQRLPIVSYYRRKYRAPQNPPSWIVSECLTFGDWCKVYPKIASYNYRLEIARRFKVEDPKVFASWIHALSVLRNTVAHYGRILDAQLGVTPARYTPWGLCFPPTQNRTFYQIATIISFLCQACAFPNVRWKEDLSALFGRYPNICVQDELGFPPDWHTRPGWAPVRDKPTRQRRKGRYRPRRSANASETAGALARSALVQSS